MLNRLRQLLARARALFQRSELDRDLDSEIESHIALLAEDLVGRGMTQEEAGRRARVELGGRVHSSAKPIGKPGVWPFSTF